MIVMTSHQNSRFPSTPHGHMILICVPNNLFTIRDSYQMPCNYVVTICNLPCWLPQQERLQVTGVSLPRCLRTLTSPPAPTPAIYISSCILPGTASLTCMAPHPPAPTPWCDTSAMSHQPFAHSPWLMQHFSHIFPVPLNNSHTLSALPSKPDRKYNQMNYFCFTGWLYSQNLQVWKYSPTISFIALMGEGGVSSEPLFPAIFQLQAMTFYMTFP